ncbi:MAG: hypothetical protein J6S60_06025 [Oscillospiraceae bacterium]|nr:hypothetical protein [Oscillospiraceae bacterium]
MTRIRCRIGADGYSVVSVGHAGSEQSCTAVSAILGALAGWVDNNSGRFTLDKGEAMIIFPKGDGADAVMDMTVIGLLQIQKIAPDDVTVEIVCEE